MPNKFGLKIWLALDIQNKYLFNGFLYTDKDETRSLNVSVPKDVVWKLMTTLFQRGYNVIYDNFFTSLDLALRLEDKRCSLAGTTRQNRREIPDKYKVEGQKTVA